MKDPLIQHEVLFEKTVNAIRHRPLFVGRAYGKPRFIIAFIVALALVGCLLAQAVWMQIVKGDYYSQLADNNRLQVTPLWPLRGLIFDRHGALLAQNVARLQVTLTPRELPLDDESQKIELGEASRLLGLTMSDLWGLAHATSSLRDETVMVADRVPYEQAMALAVALPRLPGFRLEPRARRVYPASNNLLSLSHLVGYVGRLSPDEYQDKKDDGYRHVDEIGKAGIERSYEKELRGTVGSQTNEVDALGKITLAVGEKPAINGKNVILSLDLELQKRAEAALRDGLLKAKVKRGAAVAMDPRDGSILALVSWPAYNDNDFAGGVSSTKFAELIGNENKPLFPRAWAGTYPSGSTVKIVISAAALAEKIITPQTTVLSVGGIKVGPWFFPDWKAGGHGRVNVRYAIAWSVNTFFYTIGGGYESVVGLGVDRLETWMKKFGLGEKTGVDLPAEAAGFVPSAEWKQRTQDTQWFIGDTYNLSIGQGDLLVTPLQVAVYTAAIANGGTLLTPRVAMALEDPWTTDPMDKTKKISSMVKNSQLADDSILQVVRAGMRDAVTYGSARGLSNLPMKVAAKTGTAQWNKDKNTHAWLTSFAPYDQPEVVVTVLLEEGGEGSLTALPVADQILSAWWSLRQVRGGSF